jgi:hypothetical protein
VTLLRALIPAGTLFVLIYATHKVLTAFFRQSQTVPSLPTDGEPLDGYEWSVLWQYEEQFDAEDAPDTQETGERP